MEVAFFGLTGPSGVLPRHYTEMLLGFENKPGSINNPERYVLRSWLDLFNHRLLTLFYRAWEKYRFAMAFERAVWIQEARARSGPVSEASELDAFTGVLFSLIGLGTPALRRRLYVGTGQETRPAEGEEVLCRIDDLALLYYSGLLAQRPRTAVGLEILLSDYFGLPLRVQQFTGQWLRLDPDSYSYLTPEEANNGVGLNLVVGEKVWDVQGKLRIRVGPLTLAQFQELLPDRSPVPQRKTFFLLCQLIRLYLGVNFDFDVQLVLRQEEVPGLSLSGDSSCGSRLGWDSWTRNEPAGSDAEDAIFEGDATCHLSTSGPW